jgi:hypothetical protein
MNYRRIVLAGVLATVVFFLYGFLVHGWLIAKDYTPYPEGVYRSGDAARSHTPFGLAGIFLAILVFATIYAKGYRAGAGVREGAGLGLLFGVYMIGAFVAVNYQHQREARLGIGGQRSARVDSRRHHSRDDI